MRDEFDKVFKNWIALSASLRAMTVVGFDEWLVLDKFCF
jgi:hypothetical protein